MKFIDITGNKYNMLTVLGVSHRKNKKIYWNVRCDCGTEKTVEGAHIKSGKLLSCGCKNHLPKHSMTKTKLFSIWVGMRRRCCNPNTERYGCYGGRGITVCDEWNNKKDGSINFIEWALSNGYKEGLTIERIDVNGNYEPSNCTWATRQEQNRNKRDMAFVEHDGELQLLSDIARSTEISESAIRGRYRAGLRGEELTTDEKYKARGEKHGRAKLKEHEVIEIKERLNNGETYQDIADRFGISKGYVCRIKTGRRWAHIA